MTRDIDIITQNAAAADSIRPVLFVELNFVSGAVRFHSALGPSTWGGNTYTGTGRLGSVSQVEEDSDLSRTPITLTLSGIPTDVLSILQSEHYQGRRATLYLGYLDASRQLVADPIILYRGRMDTASVEQGETLMLSMTIESRFAAWDRPLERRYNNADQQSRYPGDTGLQYVEQAVDKEIVWGRK